MKTAAVLSSFEMGDYAHWGNFSKFPLDAWGYQQLQNVCTVHLRGIRAVDSITGFESLWLMQPIDKGLLSISYKIVEQT